MRFLFTMSEIGRPRTDDGERIVPAGLLGLRVGGPRTDDGERIVPAGLLGLLDAKRFRRPAKLIFRIGRISGFKRASRTAGKHSGDRVSRT
jgi:hypothetical protein